ncbi:MAG TPA: hypothetical protein DCZ72_13695, partial [Armatimonadetes bacterium]|nr:hypothetical protein [Armatimonadota bacterium]
MVAVVVGVEEDVDRVALGGREQRRLAAAVAGLQIGVDHGGHLPKAQQVGQLPEPPESELARFEVGAAQRIEQLLVPERNAGKISHGLLLPSSIHQESSQVAVRTGLAYGEQPLQRLDLYQPESGPPAPVLVAFWHGGAWKEGSRAEAAGLGAHLAAAGYALATLDYRLGPDDLWPAQGEDAAAGVAWLWARRGGLGLG